MISCKTVGEQGRVITVDISRIAFDEIDKRVRKHKLDNVSFSLADGYNSGIASERLPVL